MRRSTTWIALAAVLMFVASACASGKLTGFPTPSPSSGSSSAAASPCTTINDNPTALNGPIDIATGNCFAPKVVTVAAGTTVDWKQSDASAPHTVTSAKPGLFDSSPQCPASKCLAGGDTFEFKFTTPGTYV